MTVSFSASMRHETADLLKRILALPFNRELAAGTLEPRRFQHYVVQDAIYLLEYGRVLARIASVAPEPATISLFAKSADGAIQVERALHASYFELFGITPEQVAMAEPSPTCLAYTDFLQASIARDGLAVGVAAILPCFRIYWDVGRRIAEVTVADNPFSAWIETYADQSFGDAVLAVEDVADRLAAEASPSTTAAMRQAYHRSCQYEWMFWDSAYRMESWPVRI
ncbi:MAG TPA: thiaminase II [Geminicoccus sp.]|jgi:thiaminase/transcriptional activator TenA|uniref:thiaminase II n=1 Tax=Geminicoccus sp. TaxID=2024832 RepID=UPI002E30C2CC|nr:thiaminase II [Geminicoccus sp.]HEX2526822.1 thiaminase II [Geminicoccus sp.]